MSATNLGKVNKIIDPTNPNNYWEIEDKYAREQVVLKLQKTMVNSLPAKPTTYEDWIAMQPFLYYLPIAGQDNEYEVWTLFFMGDPTVASDYTDTSNYEWAKCGKTDVDLSNFSTKGHTHEVVTDVAVEDHDYTPQGQVVSQFEGASGETTGDNTHKHTYTPQGSVSSSFSGTQGETQNGTTGITPSKTKKALKKKTIKLESAGVTITPSTANRATGNLESLSAYDASKAVFNGISVSDGALSFDIKKMSTAQTMTGASGSTDATKVTLGGNTTTEESLATGDLEDNAQAANQVMTDVALNDPGHKHNFTPAGTVSSSFSGTQGETNEVTHSHNFQPHGSVTSNFSGLAAKLKHRVQNHLVLTSPDQEDPSSHVFDWYGIRFNEEETNPVKTRVGNMDMHRMLPIQTKMRRCLLKDDGTVYNYLDPENSLYYAQGSKDANGNDISGRIAEIAGTAYSTYGDNTSTAFAVQVMVEISEHWRRVRTYLDGANTMVDAAVSPYLQETSGWIHIKKGYVSAYEASIIAGKLCSVSDIVNLTLAIQNGKIVATCDVSTATGQSDITSQLPTTSQTMDTFRTAARARGNEGEFKWNQQVYEQYLAVVWLYWIEYANLNSQAAFTNAKTVEGFMQGGLGNGVSTISSDNWNSFNGYEPFVPCGITNCLGNHSGEVYLTLPRGLGGGTVAVPSYRGIENFFGHFWKFADGIKYLGDGSKQSVLRCNNPADYSSASASTGYTSIGDNYGGDGWKTKIMIGDDGDINCAAAGGVGAGSNGFYCDYNYQAHANGTYYCCRLGGVARSGSKGGVASVDSLSGVALSSPNVGSRLCYFEADI